MHTYVIIYCITELRRNALLELIQESHINTLEDTAIWYDMKAKKYAITIHPYDKDMGKLNTMLFNAMSIQLVDAFHKVKQEN